MNNNLYPCLWFDGQAKQAAGFYCGIFKNSKITSDTPMVVTFEIAGIKIMGLNGGPMFRINPSISLFVTCESNEEIESMWNKFSDGGKVMMALDKYPWSEKYGWIIDRFGMTWQLMLGQLPDAGQKIMPSFLFVGEQCGNAQKAIDHYTSIIPGSQVYNVQTYKSGEEQPEGNLKFGYFSLNGQSFAAMDGTGNHDFKFNEAVSLVIECETQQEIDNFWNKFTEGGEESRCGWLKDKFGVSWQIIPKILGKLMTDPAKAGGLMEKIMKMKKFDIETLVNP